MSGCHVPMQCHCRCHVSQQNCCKYCKISITDIEKIEKLEQRTKELEDYIETGMLHNDWRHKILNMEEKIKSLEEAYKSDYIFGRDVAFCGNQTRISISILESKTKQLEESLSIHETTLHRKCQSNSELSQRISTLEESYQGLLHDTHYMEECISELKKTLNYLIKIESSR